MTMDYLIHLANYSLVATASGLFVAMTGLFAFNALNNKVWVILHQLDLVKTMLLNRLDGAPVLLSGPPQAANHSPFARQTAAVE